ncbi:Transmembrane amino acid transporter protein-like protein [Sarcoptes scabiei]|uniref:Transmembrane amino acid transporter protein-like protein n=1 Tax=Sarcoptes scabiei TaxID=52283 RepID=A0A132AH26_SARSC|nr:Transmembrane amino acid transporter protein-like protein [Sarcoptes scabiei]
MDLRKSSLSCSSASCQSSLSERSPLINDEYERDQTNGERPKPIGTLAVVFLTVNATLGAGLLNIPYSFDDSGGILSSIILQTIHVLLVIISLLILSSCTKISRTDSLQSLVRYFCGRVWSGICSASIFIYSYGACITYLIVIGDQFDKILAIIGICEEISLFVTDEE